jgi:hypothetical protein
MVLRRCLLLVAGQQTQASQQLSQLGQWQARIHKQRDSTVIEVGKGHAFAAYVGRSIASASLSQDATQGVRLTLTLADTAPATLASAAADPAHPVPTNGAADTPLPQ